VVTKLVSLIVMIALNCFLKRESDVLKLMIVTHARSAQKSVVNNSHLDRIYRIS